MINPVTFAQIEDETALDEELADDAANAMSQVATNYDPRWYPSFPSPSPLTVSTLSNRIISRVPIRLNSGNPAPSSTPAATGAVTGMKMPPGKIDPRSVRHTEAVSQVANSMLVSGMLVPKGNGEYVPIMLPRQIAGSAAFQGEVFFNTDTSKLSFKDLNGSIQPLY